MTEPLYWCCADLLMLATKLPQTPNLPAPAELRQRLMTALDTLVGRGRSLRVPDADLAEARYALVAFIDEQILKSSWPGRAEWMGKPLQLELYGEYAAGENFFNRMRVLLQQGGSSPALEVYYLCLLLGFRGAYGISGDQRALVGFSDAARQRLVQGGAGTKLAPRVEPPDRLPALRTSSAPLILVIASSLVLAVLVVIGLERLLDSNLDDSLEAMRPRIVQPATATASPAPRPEPEAPWVPTSAEALAGLQGEQPATATPWKSAPFRVDRGLRGEPPGSMPPQSHKPFPQNIANRPVPRVGEEPWLISEPWRLRHERQLEYPKRAQAKVVFLGDSITEGWRMAPSYRERFKEYTPLNLGISGDHTQNVLWRIEHGALDGTQPQVVVVLVGVNNLGGGFTVEKTVGGVKAVVTAVKTHLPSARVLLLAILPAGGSSTDKLRVKITQANRLLAGLAEPPTITFHDVGAVFLEPDGTISKDIMRDFLHPTADGYQRLSDAVAPLIEQLVR